MDRRLAENHLKLLDGIYERFDSEKGLFYEDFDSPNAYHTKLRKGRYHRYTTNSDYAVALLDGGREADVALACRVIDSVINGQCKKTGATFGLWPYFYEESLEEMDMPDWNMADFNGINLLQVLVDYSDKLDDSLREKVKQACIDACASIMRRDVTIVYTNVTVMDIYMTLVCGEMFGKSIFDFGMDKLKRFYYYVMSQKSFEEYNSPTYSIIVVNIIGLMLQHVKDEEALKMINDLNNLAWNMIAEHYHVKTGEWSGPQSRAYTDFLDATKQSFFEKALDFKIHLTDEKVFGLMDMRYDVCCPQKYSHLFTDEDRKINVKRMLSPGYNYPYFGHPRFEMLYMTPDYTLGSFHLCGGWNQHRNVMAYFGDRNKKYCLRMRILHDGYDYCSAYSATVQEKGAALTVTNFQTDRGDTHNDLDKVVNASIMAEDMRIRYQVEANTDGIIDEAEIKKEENGCKLIIAGTEVEIGFAYAKFGEETPYFEVSKDGRHIFVDVVLYRGERKQLDFKKIQAAAVVSWITVGEGGYDAPAAGEEGGYVTADWNVAGKKLSVKAIVRPEEFITSVMKSKMFIDDVNLEDLGEKIEI